MRWIFRLFGVVVSLAILAGATLFLMPSERIAAIATSQFHAATGRALVIEGAVRPTIWPVIGARVEAVRLDNADWSGAGPMFQADVVDLGLDLRALWAGDVVIKRFEAHAPRLVLERAADGRGNWEIGTTASGEGTSRRLSLEVAQITGADLRWIDHGAGTDLRVQDLNLTLRMPDFDGPAQVEGAARMNGQGVSVQGRIGSVSGLLAGQVVALAGQAQAGAGRIEFDGRAGLSPRQAEGRLSLTAPGPFLALIGQSDPVPPALRPLALSGQVTLAPQGSLHLRDGRVTAGPNTITAALDLRSDGPRPNLTGEISAAALDLRALFDGPPAGPGWSRARIDASGLNGLDANIGLTLGPVQTGLVDPASLRGRLVIDRARAVLTLDDLRVFEGRASGELVANNRSGLSVGGNLRAEGVQMLPLLRQFAGIERINAPAQAQLRFLGAGASVDAIMRSLSGEGSLALGQGEIRGFDLLGMLRSLDMNYMGEGNRTIFDSVTASFGIEGGVLRNNDLRLSATSFGAEGRGTVDLGARTLDYRVTPQALRNAETGETLRVPLLITGPWAEPRFRLDLQGLAEQRLAEERARLEAQARAEAERLAAEARARAQSEVERQLGVTRAEGESLEDAARRRLEEELGRGLQRLLGGGN